MFNLEQSIAEWRRQMLAAGIKTPVPLEELESHLREDIEQQVRTGADEARAFEMAVQLIGSPAPLKKECMKTANFKWMLLQTVKSLFGIRNVPLPALDTFEPAAQQTLELAPSEARCFNHNYVGTEHLLLGLIKSGSKSVSNVLQKLGVKSEALRREIERFVPVGPEAVTAAKIPYTPRAREALQLAANEARKLSQPQIKAEHIFLGLLREGSGVAAVVLKKLGVRLEKARAEVLKEMTAHPEAG
jgi:Clp amino terminal domain, pathogenicity island component